MGRGFDIHVDGKIDKEHTKRADEWKKYHYKSFEDTIFHERWAGHSMVVLYQREALKEEMQYFFQPYEPANYEYGYGENKTLEYAKFRDDIKTHAQVTSLASSTITRDTISDIDLEYVYHLITRPTSKAGEGYSRLLSVFDTIVTLSTLSESAMYFVVRMGAGLKVIYVPAGKSTDETYIAQIKAGIERWNAANSTIILENPDDGSTTPAKMELLTESPMNYWDVKNMLLEDIALDLGVPRARIRGIEPGNLEGAQVNESSYFDVLEEIQENYQRLLEWQLDLLNELRGWGLPDEYEIVWRKRKALTEVEEANLLSTRIDNFLKLLEKGELAGASIKVIQELTGLEYDVDEAMIAQAKADREAMRQAFQDGQDAENNLNNDNQDKGNDDGSKDRMEK